MIVSYYLKLTKIDLNLPQKQIFFRKDKSYQHQSFCQLSDQKQEVITRQNEKFTIDQIISNPSQNQQITILEKNKINHEQRKSKVFKDKIYLPMEMNHLLSAINIFIDSIEKEVRSIQHVNLPQISQIQSISQHIKSKFLPVSISVLDQQKLQSNNKGSNESQQQEQKQFQTLQINLQKSQRNESIKQENFLYQAFLQIAKITDKLILVKSISLLTQITPLLRIRQKRKLQEIYQLQKNKNNQTLQQQKNNQKLTQQKNNQNSEEQNIQFQQEQNKIQKLQHNYYEQIQKNNFIHQKQQTPTSQEKQNVKEMKNEQQFNSMECSLKFQQLDFQQQKIKKQQIDQISQESQSFQDLNEQKCFQKQKYQKQQQKQQKKQNLEYKCKEYQGKTQGVGKKQDCQRNENLENMAQNTNLQEVQKLGKQHQSKQLDVKVLQRKKTVQTKDINQIIEEQMRYLIHFSQINLQIVIEMSSNKTQSLSYTFNLVRFLIANFIIHFKNQMLLKIKSQIQHTLHNQLLYKEFQQRLKNSLRYQFCQQKLQSVKSLIITRIHNYQQKLSSLSLDQLKSPINTNVSKLHSLMKEKPQLIQFLKKLNANQVKQYSFQIAKQIYKHMITLAKQEFINYKYLQKCFRKLSKTQDLKVINMETFLQRITEFSFSNRREKKLFNRMLILILQQIKITSIMLSLPYYSFANQMENDQRKITNCKNFDKKLRQFMDNREFIDNRGLMDNRGLKTLIFRCENESGLKQQRKKQEFMQLLLRNMDSLYIMKGSKINSQNWQKKLVKDQFQFYQDVQYYFSLHLTFMDSINKGKKTQLNLNKDWMEGYLAMNKYNESKIRPIQYGRYSIFDQKEQKQFQSILKSTLGNGNQIEPTLFAFSNKTIDNLKKAIKSIWNSQ